MKHSISLGSICTGLLIMCIGFWPTQSHAQNLLQQYQEARYEERVQELLEILGDRVMPRPPVHVPSTADTVAQWIAQFQPGSSGSKSKADRTTRDIPELGTLTWEKVPPQEAASFDRRYSDVEWTVAGMLYETPLDTISTRVIRAKLEALYGPPSNTIVDIIQDHQPRGAEYIQFEYWFKINGSIPFIVLDIAGPFEEGLVFAGDVAYRDILTEAKRSLVEQILTTWEEAPYVDYYYSYDKRQWFITGFDGEEYFVRQISRPDISRGRPTLSQLDRPSTTTVDN